MSDSAERWCAFKFPGKMQWPMTRAQQIAAGLIASTNRSIHPGGTSQRNIKKRKKAGK
jgi:hypothetical protein